MRVPLDHPTPDRPHRVYVALTNGCNRACPWCSTCSSPAGSTFITREAFLAALPAAGPFELQLEGGEPTVHPGLWELVALARAEPRCTRLVLCTNGVRVPRRAGPLRRWAERLGAPLTVKLSVNHHLLERDRGLLDLCRRVRDTLRELPGDRRLVVNVRLRKGRAADDRRVRLAVERAGLSAVANVFFLQAYGLARGEPGWELPRPVWDHFTLVNPDGSDHGTDLVARSEAMRGLP